jgi:hypothetical protein
MFALSQHAILTDIGRHHQVLITAYADCDNHDVVISGPHGRVFSEQEALPQRSMMDIGLHLNTTAE